MKIILLILALLVVIATALPLLRLDQWWVRILDFPRGQITIAGVLIIPFYLYFWLYFWERQRLNEAVIFGLILGLLVLAVGYQIIKILPYTVLMPKQVRDTESRSGNANLSLLVANVLMDNRESEAFFNVVRKYNPDVVLTMETDQWWEKALRPLEVAYPHTLKKPLDNTYGMLVYSRLAMIEPEVRFILKDSIPSMHMQLVLPSNDRVFVHFVHPDPPNPKYATQTTKRDAELLIVGREVEKRDKPTIVAGDLNDVAWSHTTTLFQKSSALLDPRVGRGMYNTYNAKNPLLRWPLDHVFHSDHFRLVSMELGPAWGSDHFPIYIELSLEAGAKDDKEETGTNRAEKKQVDKKIKEGKQEAN